MSNLEQHIKGISPMMNEQTVDFKAEIEREITENKIMIYTKGTKEAPRCGFTMRLRDIFEQIGMPYTMQDVLDNPEKRLFLNEYCEWPTLPKAFINGQFCGGTDIIVEMIQNGELNTALTEAFGDAYTPIVTH
jgi:monothiol glutaredoxin